MANEVLKGGGEPVSTLLRYIMLRSPSLIETVAPLAALLGALTALIAMAKNSEILAMRAAGRSVLSLIGGLMGVGLALSMMLFIFSEYVVTRTNASLEDWRVSGFKPEGQQVPQATSNSWMIEGDTIIRVGHVMREGAVLNDLTLFKQGDDSEITDIISIRIAQWENDGWVLLEPRRVGGTNPGTGAPTWETQLRPEHFLRFAKSPSELSLTALEEYVGDVAIGTRPAYFYDTWLHQKIAGPIVLALMPLLAAIAAFAHHRQGSAVLTIVYGITFGFLFVVIDNVLLAMGQFGSLPPIFAAWVPIAFFATVGLWIIFNFEHTGART